MNINLPKVVPCLYRHNGICELLYIFNRIKKDPNLSLSEYYFNERTSLIVYQAHQMGDEDFEFFCDKIGYDIDSPEIKSWLVNGEYQHICDPLYVGHLLFEYTDNVSVFESENMNAGELINKEPIGMKAERSVQSRSQMIPVWNELSFDEKLMIYTRQLKALLYAEVQITDLTVIEQYVYAIEPHRDHLDSFDRQAVRYARAMLLKLSHPKIHRPIWSDDSPSWIKEGKELYCRITDYNKRREHAVSRWGAWV